jgi:phosphate transport system substrate-binding protein
MVFGGEMHTKVVNGNIGLIKTSMLFLAAVLLVLASAYTPADAAANEKVLSWAGCGISKKAFMGEMAKAFEKKTGVKIELKGGGATRGIREVSNGTRDLGGACRHTLSSGGVLGSNPLERRVRMDPVAWDALVVMVHKDNPVDDISMSQLRQVYLGKITNWKQLGGKDVPIDLYVRKGNISGVGRTIRELIFANYDQEFTSTAKVVKSSGPLEKAIATTAVNGLGITGVSSARKRDAKLLKINGKYPSYDNIKNGDYLLYRPLYLVTNLENNDKDVHAFIEFVHSNEGRKIMRKNGTVPYEDAIGLWLKYLESVRKAQERGLGA